MTIFAQCYYVLSYNRSMLLVITYDIHRTPEESNSVTYQIQETFVLQLASVMAIVNASRETVVEIVRITLVVREQLSNWLSSWEWRQSITVDKSFSFKRTKQLSVSGFYDIDDDLSNVSNIRGIHAFYFVYAIGVFADCVPSQICWGKRNWGKSLLGTH